MLILSELSLLNPQMIAAYKDQRAVGDPAEQEAASGPYNAELDRVIAENDLGSIVDEVIAAVTTTDPSVYD